FESAFANHLLQSPLQQITPACTCLCAFSNVFLSVCFLFVFNFAFFHCSNLPFFKSVKEEVFWRNYFYRVSLIKQSAQLTALAAQQQAAGKEEKSSGREQDLPLAEAVRPKTPPVVIKSQLKTQEDEEEISTSPGVSEFVSDAFDACNLNQEDLRKEMEQLVLDKKQEETAGLE
ncbi:synapse-associated protein 1, partial [Hylobates moloch]|uniref:synapse-associated protein 1 n=1 Tax=Hylobates moloch TaxID=81572 RepID=UPI0026757713